MRYLRVRRGDESREPDDGIGIYEAENVIVDHCSVSWTCDEAVNTWHHVRNATVQWCIVSEPLHNSIQHGHGFAMSLGGDNTSYHHNLIANAPGRNPSLAGNRSYLTTNLDFRNNVIFKTDPPHARLARLGSSLRVNSRGMESIMARASSPSSSFKDSSLSPGSSGSTASPAPVRPVAVSPIIVPPVAGAVAVPDAVSARDPQGHFTRVFKLAAVRYAVSCGKSQRAAAAVDLGISDKTLSAWINDAKPNPAGVVDADRFDELAQLRTQNRELLARTARLTAERDFLKKVAGYFATPTHKGSK